MNCASRILAGLLFLCWLPPANATTTLREAAGSVSYSVDLTLTYTIIAEDVSTLRLVAPLPHNGSGENFSQSCSVTENVSPATSWTSSGSYWKQYAWDWTTTADRTVTVALTYSASVTMSYPSFTNINMWWYSIGGNYMTDEAMSPITTTTMNIAADVLNNSGYRGLDRKLDAEASASFLQQATYSIGSPDEDGETFLTTLSGDCTSYANGKCSLNKSMGMPSGVISCISLGTQILSCLSTFTGDPALHHMCVWWEAEKGQWVLAEPQFSGTAAFPDLILLALTPDSDWGIPYAIHNASNITLTETYSGLNRTGSNWVVCNESRQVCGYSGCGNTILGTYFWGPFRSDPSTSAPLVTAADGSPLLQIWPNPSRGATDLSFHLNNRSRGELAVYNVQGRKLVSLVSGELQAGRSNVRWDGSGVDGKTLPSGVYFVSLSNRGRNRQQAGTTPAVT